MKLVPLHHEPKMHLIREADCPAATHAAVKASNACEVKGATTPPPGATPLDVMSPKKVVPDGR